jgi:hypothetical protein
MAGAGSGRPGPRAFTVGFDRESQAGQRHDIRLIGLDQRSSSWQRKFDSVARSTIARCALLS